MTISLAGQVAVVTGAGRGMGRTHSLELARRGAAVVVNDVMKEHADTVVGEIEAAGGRAAAAYDSVATREGGLAIVGTALDRFGTVDIVVNNAGFMRNGYFEDQTPDMLDAMLGVHIGGCFWVTQAAWPVMRAKGYGRVVMIGSGGGMFAMQGEANYAAGKAGVYGLSKALAFEGKPLGILVNAVLPGADTTITANDPVPGMKERFRPGMREAIGARRSTQAVSPMIVYLASRECTLSGETFDAKCGVYARVFVAVAPGWIAPDADAVSAEDLIEHLDEIRAQNGYFVPEDNYEEMEDVARKIGWRP